MLRRSNLIALAILASAGGGLLRSASAAPPAREQMSVIRLVSTTPSDEMPKPADVQDSGPAWQQPDTVGEMFPQESPAMDDSPPGFSPSPTCEPPATLEDYAAEAQFDGAPLGETPSESFFSKLKWLGFRHSSYNGRSAGRGVPLVGTSWLNRPYYVGADLGPMWVTHPPQEEVTDDIDLFGGIYVGLDCDYYWGAELAVQRATPELINTEDSDAERGDRLMLWTANVLYYPWGDSMIRPYWRCGIGAMEIDFPTEDGRRDESLWAIPIGVGIKYPIRRWLATRAEFADNIGLGNDGIATQHNLSLTFSLEWRFGAHPRSYWPWNPSRHIW